MMQQYLAFKKKHQDAILLFRMGDFYEVFLEDARVCSRDLGLALTSRDKGENAVPMAGFPHHAADTYIKRLIRAGHRVAICEQVQDPAEATGLVERDVTRVITAGTLTEDQILDSRSNNFLAAVASSDSLVGLAWADLSTGKFEVQEMKPEALAGSLQRISPAECLLPQGDYAALDGPVPTSSRSEEVLAYLSEGCLVTRRPPWEFNPDEGRRRLNRHFGTQALDGFVLPPQTQDQLRNGLCAQALDDLSRRGTDLLVFVAHRLQERGYDCVGLKATLREGRHRRPAHAHVVIFQSSREGRGGVQSEPAQLLDGQLPDERVVRPRPSHQVRNGTARDGESSQSETPDESASSHASPWRGGCSFVAQLCIEPGCGAEPQIGEKP